MNREEFFYLLPYLCSLALSLGIFIYTWRHRYVRGARMYSWFAGGQTLTILGFIFELISPNLQTKILWDKFQWLTDSFLVFIPFLIFSIQFTEFKLRYPRLTWGLWLSIPILFTAVLLTDSLHHLIYLNPHLSTDYPFPDLQYSFTFVVYIYALVYVYTVNFYGISLLVRRAIQPHNLYRLQYLTIAVGFFMPLALSIFSLVNIKITQQRDISPFSLAIGNLIVAWGLFRYRLFDIVPIARERIVENMSDPVIVLDDRNRIVDINAAALKMIKKEASEVVGRASTVAFAKWPLVVELLDNFGEQRKEVSTKYEDDTLFFDINASPILNHRQKLIGRIVVARDITKHKTLEAGYRMLSAELEERVESRTKELQESAARYRAVVENQTEFIVRWKPDGTRTFVNEAYCRYFELTFEQAIASNFLTLVAEEDRRPIEEKIARLRSGITEAETDIHQVIKPDGSVGWQEWTDQAIRDANGKIIEFQSVGRDITERKQAEVALRSSEERFSKAFQQSPSVITISQLKDGRLLEVNDAFEKIVGYTREEVLERTTKELGLWVNLADRERYVSALLANGKVRNEEVQFRTKSGRIITCLFAAERIELGSEQCILTVIEDITERKKAESRILHLNRLYVTISQINQTLVHTRDKDSLFRDICQVAINHGRFRMAWIGIVDENDVVKPVVFAGEELGYLANMKINFRDEFLGSGPTGTAIREERCIICQDIATDPRMAPWREAALSRGYFSSAAVPLRQQGQIVGALTVYADEPNGFDPDNEELLEQIGQDVSFALDSIHADTKRKQAEAILLNQLAFDELMTSLLAKFATCSYNEVDASIEFALQTIAEFLGGDLANLFALSRDRTSWNSTHKWVAPHMQILENSKSVIVSGEQLAWTENQLLGGNTIIIKTLDDYPPEATSDHKFAAAQGVKSILTIPIKGQEQQVFGCIDIVAYRHQLDWSDNDVARLRLIGDAIANLLERKHAEENLAEAYDTTLEGWAKALELRDKETEGHSRRVTETTIAVARGMGFNDQELIHIRRGSILHDIGKMGIPDDILRKNGDLTEEERVIVNRHPVTARDLLKPIAYLQEALDIPYYHHEKWDGTGYPRGLRGEQIPLPARIFAVVDVWDALSSDRPYRNAWPREKIEQYLISESATHFDPNVVTIFLKMVEKGEI